MSNDNYIFFLFEGFELGLMLKFFQHCKCMDNCTTEETCNCSDLSVKSWYDLDGRLKDGFDYKETPMIFECNDLCSCNVNSCHNR